MIRTVTKTEFGSIQTCGWKLFVQFTIVGEPDVGGLVSESKIVEEGSTLKLTSVRECIRDVMYKAVCFCATEWRASGHASV